MKNMQSFSITIFTLTLIFYTAPMFAMGDGPGFNFPEFNKSIKQSFQDGIKYVGEQAHKGVQSIRETFTNAPKEEKTESDNKPDKLVIFSDERTGKEYFAKAIANELDNQDLLNLRQENQTPVPVIENSSRAVLTENSNNSGVSQGATTQIVPETITAPQVKTGFSLKAMIQAHPIIIGVVVAGVIAVPLAIFGWKQLQKNKKQTASVKAV